MIARPIVYAGAAFFAWIGLTMIAGSQDWYQSTPGVPETGGYNPHFIVDIGFAFLVSAGCLAAGAWMVSRPLMLAGLAWPALHAGFHLLELVTHGPASPAALVTELAGVVAPVGLIAVACFFVPGLPPGLGAKSLMHALTRRFERQWRYDAAYLHEIADLAPETLVTFQQFQTLARYRGDASPDLLAGATLAAVLREDCGPCAQLNIDMLQAFGTDPAQIRALVKRDFDAASSGTVLGFRFAEHLIDGHPETDALRELIAEQYGPRATLALAYAVLVTRSYPMLKRALGHGQACLKLDVGGESTAVVAA